MDDESFEVDKNFKAQNYTKDHRLRTLKIGLNNIEKTEW